MWISTIKNSLPLIFLSFFLVCTQMIQAQSLVLLSFNIRYNNPKDGVNAWPNRKDRVKGLVEFYGTDILCVQEALWDQVRYLEQIPSFARIGVGRDDGKEQGEFSAIFYNSHRFQALQSGTFWLSPTPDKPSVGWDAALERICTWVELRDTSSRQTFFVFNTHYDHRGKEARYQASQLLLKQIQKLAGDTPVLLSGDFNSLPDQPPIQHLTTQLQDAREVSQLDPYGPVGTFNSFEHSHPLDRRIDYVFVNEKVSVLKYGVLTDSWDERYPSDHLPVYVQVEMKE